MAIEDLHLSKSEKIVMEMIWNQPNLTSREFVALCESTFGWKSTTAYTVLRRLCDKGMCQNQDSKITAQISREEYQNARCQNLVDEMFQGSLPSFITAFAGNQGLNQAQIEELKAVLAQYEDTNDA